MAHSKRVTMQTVADACGLSRNTVSKIFNGYSSVPESTRAFVLEKAQALGYRYTVEKTDASSLASASRNIALLTHSRPSIHSFGSLLITNFTDQICRAGYNLKIFEINDFDYANKTLPSHFNPKEIAGIIVIELFNREYTQMLCNMNLPLILVDSYVHAPSEPMQCDLIYMENYASTVALTARMLEAGAQSIGFVGDINHCSSFRERWNGFCTAMLNAGRPVDKSVCILADDAEPYGEVDWMLDALNRLSRIPEGFVCCNDFVAIRVMQALHRKGLRVPEDVMVTGFDGTTEGEVVSPSLTTAKIPTADIGRISADILLTRISNPQLPYRCTFVQSTLALRESTRNL